MRILLTADPYIPIPPKGYGGIERIIDMLVKGYLKRGHEVILLAHPDSKVDCKLIPYGIPPHSGLKARLGELWQIWSCLHRYSRSVDIIHSFSRLAGLVVLYSDKVPKIQSYQREVVKRGVWLVDKFFGNRIFFTACSNSVWVPFNLPGKWKTIYNGVPLEKFSFKQDVALEAPLLFLGRLERAKGAHLALEIARLSGSKLVIAGNIIKAGKQYEYFRKEIEPYIDANNVKYVGEVDDAAKNVLLGQAKALLVPSICVDPCPVVLFEALSCGTPVIALRTGGIPEVIRDGINGFVCDSSEEMAKRVSQAAEISRAGCRQIAETRFSSEVITEEYLKLYNHLLCK